MRRASKAFGITLPAILSALGLLILYLSTVAPSGRWGIVAVAGLLPAAAVISVKLWAGVAVYLVTGLLGFLLIPDRLNILLYVLFFGIYTILKSLLERISPIVLSYLLKLVFFNGILTLFLFVFSALFLPALPEVLAGRYWVLYLGGSIVFLVYDFGFSKLITFYVERVDKAVKR